MSSPYTPPKTNHEEVRPSTLGTILQRLAAAVLCLVGWLVLVNVTVWTIGGWLGNIPSVRTPESELSSLESFSRFCLHYWFLAFLLFTPPVCLVAWMLLKLRGVRKTRWLLLAISLAMAPVLLVIAWLLFRSLLFPP
ncbi:MAG: hypothetical protein KatS3mg111_4080 [Pirellulaceae bacterium]|nr:MAG: hypothetical protein KatS3mg111_4080 [Pirellulaceae bacterium]